MDNGSTALPDRWVARDSCCFVFPCLFGFVFLLSVRVAKQLTAKELIGGISRISLASRLAVPWLPVCVKERHARRLRYYYSDKRVLLVIKQMSAVVCVFFIMK